MLNGPLLTWRGRVDLKENREIFKNHEMFKKTRRCQQRKRNTSVTSWLKRKNLTNPVNALCVSYLDYTFLPPLTLLNLESIALMKFSVVSAYICILIKYII